MNTILGLLAAAGITFGVQNKVAFLHGKSELLDSLLKCTYCAGFHAGWLVWLMMNLPVFSLQKIILFAFASAIFSYGLDELIKYFEERVQAEE